MRCPNCGTFCNCATPVATATTPPRVFYSVEYEWPPPKVRELHRRAAALAARMRKALGGELARLPVPPPLDVPFELRVDRKRTGGHIGPTSRSERRPAARRPHGLGQARR